MNRKPSSCFFSVLFLMFVFLTSGWAQEAPPAHKDAPATKKSAGHRRHRRVASAHRTATSDGATTKKMSKRVGTRRRHYYGQTWSTSPYADSATHDVTTGDDPVARAAAVQALGPLNGSIVVVDPHNGRILT